MKQRLIKRYTNRKLYDTAEKKYVSLEQLAQLIATGESIQVVDKANGQDITNQILTQIILEKGKKGNSTIPSEVLHQIIRWGESVIETGLDRVVTGVDKLVQDSIKRIAPEQTKEIEELEAKIDQLETIIESLAHDINTTKTS